MTYTQSVFDVHTANVIQLSYSSNLRNFTSEASSGTLSLPSEYDDSAC